jgi:hypothetical protein
MLEFEVALKRCWMSNGPIGVRHRGPLSWVSPAWLHWQSVVFSPRLFSREGTSQVGTTTPAVTLAVFLRGRVRGIDVLGYFGAQIVRGLLGAVAARMIVNPALN